MNLIYRGLSYNADTSAQATYVTQYMSGVYRGAQVTFRYAPTDAPESAKVLQYRGLVYLR